MHKSSRQLAYWAICLTVLLSLTSSHATSAPYVLIVAPQDIPEPGAGNRQLVKISPEGRIKIADVSYATLFGMDDSTLAFVNSFTNENRLLVIDRQSPKIISNTTITEVMPNRRHQSVENLVAVQSKNSAVYFPIFDYGGHHGFGFAEVNWKTGRVRQFPAAPPKGFGDTLNLISLPSGFAVSSFGNMISLFHTETKKQILKLPEKGDDYSWITRRMYYAPTIGLMEYYQGEHLQLTDTNLSAITLNPERFPSSEVKSKIFVRTIHRKPCLVWGENKAPKIPQTSQTTVTDLVFYDVESKKEMLRKSLGGSFSEYILPNQIGTRVYFIRQQTGEICCLDRESQTISPFAKSGVKAVLHSYSVMVDAN